MGLRTTIKITGFTEAIDSLEKLAAIALGGGMVGIANEVMEREAQQFRASTPVSTVAHNHMASNYTVGALPDGSIMQNLTSYAGLIVYTGAEPHDIPNSFGVEGWGYGSQRHPPRAFWHPGFKPNPELKALWDDAPARLQAEMDEQVEWLVMSVFP